MLTGSMIALVTPMSEGGEVVDDALANLIDFHVEAGTEALIIAGTTGESATLTKPEHVALVRRSCELADGRIPIIAGTGSNSTQQTIELSQQVDELPVAGFLVVTPYYNKPTQQGLVEHFFAVADAVRKPILLYNVPGRTAVDMLPEAVGRASAHERIVGIKEATGNVDRVSEIREAAGEDFILLSGDDLTAREFMLAGGHGVISVTGNVAPRKLRALCDAARSGDSGLAADLDGELADLHRDLFVESNPIPVKWALHKMGLIPPGIRLPLTPLSDNCHETVLAAMAKAGVQPV